MRHKTVNEWMSEKSITLKQLVEWTGLDRRTAEAIAAGRYTTSPAQRARIAKALGVAEDTIAWSQAGEVDSLYGHGPQFGRSP